MPTYWIMPVESDDPLILAADRVCILGSSEWEQFRAKLHHLKPRLLPMVKGSILPVDPAAPLFEACGSETGPVYDKTGPVSFACGSFSLSDCGRAFVDRLPSALEQSSGFQQAEILAREELWTDKELDWLQNLKQLSESNRKLMLVRED